MSHEASERVVLVHLSDLHAGQRFYEPASNKQDAIGEKCKRMFEAFTDHTFGSLKLTKIDLLVLSGDLTDRAQIHEFAGLVKHFIEPLIGSNIFKQVLAVPGNHDVDWKLVRKPNVDLSPLSEFDQLSSRNFQNLPSGRLISPTNAFGPTPGFATLGATGWCQVVPFNSVSLGGTAHPDIQRYLLLDPEKRDANVEFGYARNPKMMELDERLGDIPPVDPAYVLSSDLDRTRRMLQMTTEPTRKPFRIAVLHHNPIPYRSEGPRPRAYRFINDGAFNDYLVRNQFHLVLHGHQHLADLFYFSHLPPDGIASGLENGFLCLGAPAFGANDAYSIGFNIITIERARHLATVRIQRLTWGHDLGGDVRELTEKPSEHFVPLEVVDDRRRTLLKSLSTMVMNRDRVLELERLAGVGDAPSEAGFFRQLRALRETYKNIRGMYSLSVFPPELWSDKRLAEFFLPEARRNIARAAALAKSLEVKCHNATDSAVRSRVREIIKSGTPNLLFRFSRTVHEAIQSARAISETLQVSNLVREALDARDVQNLNDRDLNFIKRTLARTEGHTGCVDKSCSFSIWDNVCSVAGIDLDNDFWEGDLDTEATVGMSSLLDRVSVEDMRFNLYDPPYSFDPASVISSAARSQLAEFPRILLWTERDLDSPSAIECIEFHENCAFPLYWIRPDALKNRSGTVRRYIGHFSIVDAAITEVFGRWNDEKGNEPEGRPDEFYPDKVKWLWHEAPPFALLSYPSFIDEFLHLLRRPDIMFAADAWAMRKIGNNAWAKLGNHLDSIKLTAWNDDATLSQT